MSDSVRPHRRQPIRLPIPGILHARTLEWVAISFSNAWKWKAKVKSLSRVRLLATPWTAAYQAPPSMGFSNKSTGVGCHCLLCLSHRYPNINWRWKNASAFDGHITRSHQDTQWPLIVTNAHISLHRILTFEFLNETFNRKFTFLTFFISFFPPSFQLPY